MAEDKIIDEIATLKQYGDYVGSALNNTISSISELERRVSELESIIGMVKDIDWTTVKFKDPPETF